MQNFQWIETLKPVLNLLDFKWYFVGGCVRDSLLGIETKDIDITTTAEPNVIEQCVKGLNTSMVGKRFGTIGVFYKGWTIEITTTRSDICTYGRHADVKFITSFEEDSKRRDFTINALLFDGKEFLDFHNGLNDLKHSKIKFIGEADLRIKEDYLRILRYIRFLARFSKDFNYNEYKQVIIDNIQGLKQISIERIINEIYSMCKYNNTYKAIEILNDLGISNLIFGENLNTKIQDSWARDKKMAFIFIFLNKWKKLSIPKSAKIYLECSIIYNKDPILNFIYIWNRHHNIDYAYLFLEIYNEINNTNITIDKNLENFNYNKDFLNSFEDKQKTKVMIIIKYLFINNMSITLEQIQNHMSILF